MNGFRAAAVVFAGAFLVRWVTLDGLSGDDHASLWTAAAFLSGDLPVRDFVDLGYPLHGAISALAQKIAGYRVIGEVVLGATLFAFAFGIAFHLAWRASGSLGIAAALTLFALLVATQRGLYSYPKTMLYPLALWLAWRYIDRSTPLRAVALGVGVALAFGYRHDHGAYTGIGAAAAVLAAHWREGMRRVAYAWLRLGTTVLVVLSPYLVLMQVHEGIVRYFRDRIQVFQVADASSRRPVQFRVDATAPPHWLRIDPPRPARVFVEWKPEVTGQTRTALEQQYSLTNGLDPKKGMLEYLLTDVSRDTLSALVSDPRIVDRSGISVSYRDRGDGSKVIEDVGATEAPPAGAPDSARALVEIRWSGSLDETERTALERRYGLLDTRTKWEYALADVSADNIRAIVDDPRVYDTGLLDRDIYRPMEESWLDRLQRSVPLLRISVAPRYWHRDNAATVLHDVAYTLPYILIAVLLAGPRLGWQPAHLPHAREKLFAAAVMMAVAYFALLRRDGYFADHAPATAVLGACALGWIPGASREAHGAAIRTGARVIAALVLVVTGFAAVTYARPVAIASAAGMSDGPRGVWTKAVRDFRAYTTSPPIDEYAPRDRAGDRALIRYIYECTRPGDRIWLLSDLFTFAYYTERPIVGHVYWSLGLLSNPEFERKTIARVDAMEVPIILSIGGQRPLQFFEAYPLVHEYVAQRYTRHYSIPEESVQRGSLFWLLTDSRRTPTGTYELLGLPCFK